MGWSRKSRVWAEQSAPTTGHPGPAFQDSRSGARRRRRTMIWGCRDAKGLGRVDAARGSYGGERPDGGTCVSSQAWTCGLRPSLPRPPLALTPQSTAPHCCSTTLAKSALPASRGLLVAGLSGAVLVSSRGPRLSTAFNSADSSPFWTSLPQASMALPSPGSSRLLDCLRGGHIHQRLPGDQSL